MSALQKIYLIKTDIFEYHFLISSFFLSLKMRGIGAPLSGRRVDLSEHILHTLGQTLRRTDELLRPLGRVQLR